MSASPAVLVRGLTVSYRGRSGPVVAVRDLDLSISAGESYGLVGESGSGKSTAAMTLTRYLPPGTGISAAELSVDGVPVLDLDAPALRRFRAGTLSVVYQEPGLALDPTMAVGRQIGDVYRLHGATRAQARERALAAIERVRLSPAAAIARRYPHEMSGGQQQRIVIAMALASEPRLLILDEPTTGLDSRVETDIMALIDALRADLGFASILISHNLPLIAAHCQRIGVLESGELVEEGAAADVLLAPRHRYTRSLIASLPDIERGAPARPGAAALAGAEGRAGAASGPLVTVEHLTKRYQQRAALRDVSFTIGRAEVLGLVGESGSGKTTLGLSLAGLTSHEGSITFHTADRRQRRGWRRKTLPRVQVVFQNADSSLNPRRTVRQVLARSIELLGGDQTVEELAARTGVEPGPVRPAAASAVGRAEAAGGHRPRLRRAGAAGDLRRAGLRARRLHARRGCWTCWPSCSSAPGCPTCSSRTTWPSCGRSPTASACSTTASWSS